MPVEEDTGHKVSEWERSERRDWQEDTWMSAVELGCRGAVGHWKEPPRFLTTPPLHRGREMCIKSTPP